jgi:hypothetical protein
MRGQSEPCRKLAAGAELARIWNGRCNGGRRDRSDARDGRETAAGLVGSMPLEDLPFEAIDLLRQCPELLDERRQRRSRV